jgi:hypothetical protein
VPSALSGAPSSTIRSAIPTANFDVPERQNAQVHPVTRPDDDRC